MIKIAERKVNNTYYAKIPQMALNLLEIKPGDSVEFLQSDDTTAILVRKVKEVRA